MAFSCSSRAFIAIIFIACAVVFDVDSIRRHGKDCRLNRKIHRHGIPFRRPYMCNFFRCNDGKIEIARFECPDIRGTCGPLGKYKTVYRRTYRCAINAKRTAAIWKLVSQASPQDDLRLSRLSSPPSSQGTGDGTRTRDKRLPEDLRADSLATVPPTPLEVVRPV
ncbi:hypothetical protein PoB_000406600 [Plakobranchus ocellatus]|uniref:Secreted protein n=1 Tax=Plakobranchus ocellatus TaxID=259542 RepID=A0AAV3Y571_9GAST|nr:hypothetical protein PoB_000406600 [Plakobranchus ocellatus]